MPLNLTHWAFKFCPTSEYWSFWLLSCGSNLGLAKFLQDLLTWINQRPGSAELWVNLCVRARRLNPHGAWSWKQERTREIIISKNSAEQRLWEKDGDQTASGGPRSYVHIRTRRGSGQFFQEEILKRRLVCWRLVVRTFKSSALRFVSVKSAESGKKLYWAIFTFRS